MELGFDIGSACSDAALIEIVEASPFLNFHEFWIIFNFTKRPKMKIPFSGYYIFFISKYNFYFELYSKNDNNYTLVVKFREFGHQ